MPTTIAKTAASGGSPPTVSAIAIATGVVVDFGAIVRASASSPPNAWTSRTALDTETTAPRAIATSIGTRKPLRRCACRCRGTASATVAGPSQKAISSVPER